jgi:predicted DCC family thiol-disulfide oxidoreductase YuxK
MAKLVALCLLLKGLWLKLPEPFLPFLSALDHVGSPTFFQRLLQLAFVVSAAALLFNCSVRISCLVLGSTILLSILSSRPFYQSNRLFCACLLLMAALQRPGRKPWLLRWQVATVYFGAGLNKLADVDWRSGQFFQNWVVGLHHQALYAKLAAWLPGLLLSRMMSWATIVIELSLFVGFLVPRFYPLAIWGNIMLQTALMFSTGKTFGMFYYAMVASSLVFVDWPQVGLAVLYDGNCHFCAKLRNFFERADLEGWFRWVSLKGTPTAGKVSEDSLCRRLRLSIGRRAYAGFEAIKMLLLFNPLTYFLLLLVFTAPQPSFFAYRKWVAILLLAFFSPLFGPLGEALYDQVTRNRHFLPHQRGHKPFPAAMAL